jgi:sugar O-acyltransferase (sialic acid O-acetyltransferase NeuD family)
MRSAGPDLVLLGAGGLAREAVEATRMGRATGVPLGYLDDDVLKHGQLIAGLPVLGSTTAVAELDPGVLVVAAVASSADPGRRARLVQRLALPDQRYGTILHPDVSLAPSTLIGVGAIVLAGVVATSHVAIGRHVAIMPGCILTHDVVLGDGCTLASGVQLAGGVVVEPRAYLGTGAMVREGLRIGGGAVIGMGAVVLSDVPAGEVWAGVPARKLRAAI